MKRERKEGGRRRTLRRKRCLGIGEHKIPGGVERERDQEKSEKERER